MKQIPEIVTTSTGRKLSLHYVNVGINFATECQLRSGKRVVATTEIVPYGFTSAARDRALKLAEKL